MSCTHTGSANPTRGYSTRCSKCSLDIIWDGARWCWIYELSQEERHELRRAHISFPRHLQKQ